MRAVHIQPVKSLFVPIAAEMPPEQLDQDFAVCSKISRTDSNRHALSFAPTGLLTPAAKVQASVSLYDWLLAIWLPVRPFPYLSKG